MDQKVFENESILRLVNRTSFKHQTVVMVGPEKIGSQEIIIIAGPCSVENRQQLFTIAKAVKKSGAKILRGGAYKPRTSPYSFQGLREEGLNLLTEVRQELGLPVVTEIMDPRKLEGVCATADMLQIGSRNMHNSALLSEMGQVKKPILLKRGMSATIEELLFAAEYILKSGNTQVVLCERGIRTFDTVSRFTLDLNAIPVLKRETHLPVIVDPSHGTGHLWMVSDLARAAVAAGADGLIIEVHRDPDHALSDGSQSLTPEKFDDLMHSLSGLAQVIGRKLKTPVAEKVI